MMHAAYARKTPRFLTLHRWRARLRGYDGKTLTLLVSVLSFAPILTAFAVEDLLHGRIAEGVVTLLGAGALLGVFALLVRGLSVLTAGRTSSVLVLVLLAGNLGIGAGDGYGFVWFYVYPAAAFYLLGGREGLAWVFATLVIAAVIIFSPVGHSYPSPVGGRFVVSYLLVSIVCFSMEAARTRLERRLKSGKAAAEQATLQVKTLRGLVPICASCKKIRDEAGTWKKLETFIKEHTEADFSHSMCPECISSAYPERNE